MNKMKYLKEISRLFLASLVIAAITNVNTVLASSPVTVTALDTVSNFGTVIKASGAAPSSHITFDIKKPDGSSLSVPADANSSGEAQATLGDKETRLAGTYQAVLAETRETANFTVFPGDMNPNASGVYVQKSPVQANGFDSTLVTVRIVDEFTNPLPFHEVKLTSNRGADGILEQSSETDKHGLLFFHVNSTIPGISILTALDTTAGQPLNARPQIFFSKPATVFASVGGDPETILLAQGNGGSIATAFKIENMPATATVNDALNCTVSAVDSLGNTVASYLGKITFTSTDQNATVPSPYTFAASDQGKHTFNLGLTFSTTGTQKLTVQEQGSPTVKGEKTVTITNVQHNVAGEVKITKPATGTYAVSTLEIAGEANPNASVKINDNGQQIAEVQADSGGRFFFTTAQLTDGNHTFQAQSLGVQSESVPVTVDTTPAQVQDVSIDKTNLAPDETTGITVRSDPDLNSIQATVDQLIVDLKQDDKNPGVYRGILTAPAQDGEYTVNIIITDKIGNSTGPKEVGKLRVDASLKQGGNGVTTFSVPSVVKNVKALPGNSRVTLMWSPAQAEAGIAFYRIYYSTDPQNLQLVVNTKDSNTTWYIPNLQNGTTYYFQVVGVDTQGVEGDNRSDVVSAAPSATATNTGGANGNGNLGGANYPVLCDPGPCPPNAPTPNGIPQDGPEVFYMIAASLLGGGAYRLYRKRGR